MKEISELPEPTKSVLMRWSIDMAELSNLCPQPRGGEVLAIIGSVVEGLSNDQSDLDILYIGDQPLNNKIVMLMDDSYAFGISHDRTGREVNIEQLTSQHIDELQSRVFKSLNCLTSLDPSQANYVERNMYNLKMLHRIKTAVPLAGAAALSDIQHKLRLSEFHEFVCLSLVQDILNQQEDIVGEIRAGNRTSAAWHVCTSTFSSILAALLASIGETNAHTKWHYNLFERNSDAFAPAVYQAVRQYIGQGLSEVERNIERDLPTLVESVLQDIYSRQRRVYRAAKAFSIGVRFSDLNNPNRWSHSKK